MQIWKGATLFPNEHKLIKNMHTTQLSRLVHSLLLEPTSYSSPVQPCCLFIFFKTWMERWEGEAQVTSLRDCSLLSSQLIAYPYLHKYLKLSD